MQLTRFTDYSLRVLIFLCHQPADKKISLDFLATQFNMNHHHLTKISQKLVSLGWVHSTRGKSGGLTIDTSTKAMDIGSIVKALESNVMPIDCAGLECPISNNCKLAGALYRAAQAFLEVLSSYRLEDIALDEFEILHLSSQN